MTVMSKSSGLAQLELSSLSLRDCSVRRGQADPGERGAIRGNLLLEHESVEGGVTYSVNSTYTFVAVTDDVELERDEPVAEKDVVAEISATYVADYNLPEGLALDERELDLFGDSVIMQVTPFHREFLASMTNRMGIPPFLLPLLRLSEVRAQRGR